MTFVTLFDRYVFKNLSLTIVFVTVILTSLIVLTQSLRFLELIINAGASSAAFWTLTFLALPRFLEIILPIATMVSCIFIYNRMNNDSELIVLRAAGLSPMQLARPALIIAGIITILLLFITTWLAPTSLSSMHKMRNVLKTQYSTLLFREGVFNPVGDNLTIYVDNRNKQGELEGLLIHDSRSKTRPPYTITAKRGILVMNEEKQQVLVYDGTRQDFNSKTGALNRLDFDRYSVDFPETGLVTKRWKEPDERTFWELLNPNRDNTRDIENLRAFKVEAHRRITAPFLAISFTLTALCYLLLGVMNRRGQSAKIFMALSTIIILEGLYLSIFGFAAKHLMGLILMYLIIFLPLIISGFLLSSYGEDVRKKLLLTGYKKYSKGATV